MAGAIKRGKAIRADLALWDGLTQSYSRIDATGGTVSGLTIGNEVDVLQVYGAGTSKTRASILTATNMIGTAAAALVFAPGTWTIDDNLTIPSNLAAKIPAGCVFSVSSGKTLTFSGPVYAESSTFYSGAGTTVLSVDSIVGGKPWIARTAAEIAASVTPVFYTYKTSPKIDVRRYLTAWDNGSVQTTGLQTAINYAFARKGRLILPDGLAVASGALTLTMTGNRTTSGLAIEGAGPNSSVITQSGTPTEVFNFSGETPTSNPTEAQLVLENFSVKENVTFAKNAHGITINGIGGFRLSNVHLQGFDRALNLSSALIGIVDQDCYLGDGKTGIYIRRNGAGSTANLLRIRDSRININSSWAVDFNGGSQLQLYSNDMEANGTTTVTTTGAIVIRGALAPDSLVAGILMDGNWLESNFGQSILVEAPTGGVTTNIAIRGGNIIAAESGRAIKVLGASRLLIEDLQCLTPGDTWDLTCTQATLINCIMGVLTDSGVTYPSYSNVAISTGVHYNGRSDSATLTITGCTTSPTGSATIIQQGNEITITFPDLTGTSNTTACTLTGLPAKYQPTSGFVFAPAIVEDNSLDAAEHLLLLVGSGTITLYKNGSATGFTASGSKGIRRSVIKYRL